MTEQLYKLDALMESVAKAVEGMEIDSVVAEVVEVAQYRRGAEREQVRVKKIIKQIKVISQFILEI